MADARLGIAVSADAKQASATFRDLAADIKKVGTESVEVTDGVDKVTAALTKLSKASDTPGALAEAAARAKLEIDELRGALEKTPASAQKIAAINGALAQADAAIQRTITRAAKLKDTQEQVNAKIGLTAKGAESLAGSLGSLDGVMGRMADSSSTTAQNIAKLGFQVAAAGAAFKLGHEAASGVEWKNADAERDKVLQKINAIEQILARTSKSEAEYGAAVRANVGVLREVAAAATEHEIALSKVAPRTAEAAQAAEAFAAAQKGVAASVPEATTAIKDQAAALAELGKSVTAAEQMREAAEAQGKANRDRTTATEAAERAQRQLNEATHDGIIEMNGWVGVQGSARIIDLQVREANEAQITQLREILELTKAINPVAWCGFTSFRPSPTRGGRGRSAREGPLGRAEPRARARPPGAPRARTVDPGAEALRGSLLEIAGTAHGDINLRTLGRFLSGYVDRIEGGLVLRRDGRKHGGSPSWRVRDVQNGVDE